MAPEVFAVELFLNYIYEAIGSRSVGSLNGSYMRPPRGKVLSFPLSFRLDTVTPLCSLLRYGHIKKRYVFLFGFIRLYRVALSLVTTHRNRGY